MPSNSPLIPAELRERAARARRMAEYFFVEADRLQAMRYAEELEAEAVKLELRSEDSIR